MTVELDKIYAPRAIEREMLARWDQFEAYRATPDDRGPDQRFVVMIPLPNVTGMLHMGHAINNTLQDVMTRWHRMRGFNALYQPGTDHAGIATQAVVERRILQDEGKSRHDFGRDELVRRIWEWKDQYEQRILKQLKAMGCSCDWTRVRFTLDENYSDSVSETFFRWFRAGLIYRGERLVNWDTHLRTAVADDEVYHKTVRGKFWHFKYPLKNPVPGDATHLGFATTRPETMLGDVALAVNPEDVRYRSLIGQTVLVPLFDPPREIPIIADEWADPEKGTGCVKITPAHDPNDYEVGLRHDLPMMNIMTADGHISEHGGRYTGQTMSDAREAVVEAMDRLGLLDRIDDIDVDLPHSDRSKSPIEPFLSPQWFVRMGDIPGGVTLGDGATTPGLAQAAMDAVRDQRVRIFPDRYTRTYLDWLGEKRDWCISRQLWWGHQIPVWSKSVQSVDEQVRLAGEVERKIPHNDRVCVRQESGPDDTLSVAVSLARHDAECIAQLDALGFVRDPDVLDTWFSSQLWPYATLGWPDNTSDLQFYYPGTVLITSRDIITLWVARMVASGLYNIGEVPFRHTYIHPKILDGRGETMSKSKGNGIDPLDIIETYGADAMRYSLADMTTETQDVRMPVDYRCPHCETLMPQTADNMQAKQLTCRKCKTGFATRWADESTAASLGQAGMVSDKFEIGRNFCNKLWNAARFAFMNLEGLEPSAISVASLPTEDRWILAQLSRTVREFHAELSQYRFSASIKLLRDFFWDCLCDWYIELTKARLGGGAGQNEAKQILAFCLDQVLRLFHPFIPFITERLWMQLNEIAPNRGLSGIAEPDSDELLMRSEFPPADGWDALDDDSIVSVFETLQSATRGVRDLRSRNNVPPKQDVTVTIDVPPNQLEALREQSIVVQRLANVGTLWVESGADRPTNAATMVLGHIRVYVHDISDDDAERFRLEKELAGLAKQISGKEQKLKNERFVQNARPEIVAAERERLEALLAQRKTVKESLSYLR